jgi:hypothetical protein
MGVIGQEIEGYAVDQIKARQVLHGSGKSTNRNTDQISVLNANSSWISLASGVSISKSKLTELGLSTSFEGMGLAKANILFSGTSKSSTQGLKQKEGFLGDHRDSSYTYGDYGYSPMPGITSVDVKTLNRGSLKKATVKIKINNRQQFDIIDVLYLRLGYTVLLEWGNSLYTTTGHDKQLVEDTLLENLFFSSAFNKNSSYRDILPPIAQYRDKYNGNYDALLGKVSNFNWSFNHDGSYDAEITIISLGDVIESLKLNIPTNKQLNAFILKVSGEIAATPSVVPPAVPPVVSPVVTPAGTPIAPTSGAVPILPGNYSTSNDNNPFNLRQNGGDITKQFNGALGKKADPGNDYFVVFNTIDNGVRAGMKNLSNYFVTKRLRTLNNILTVYCPGYSTSYKNYILGKMKAWDPSVTWTSTLPDFKGNLETNASTITMFRTLVKAIFTFEGGDSKYLTNIDSFPIPNL